jgi:hypothetical protein
VFVFIVFTIVTFFITISSATSSFFLFLAVVVVVFNTTFLSEVVKFGSIAAVSVELDVLAGGVEEVEALGVGEVNAVQDGDQQEKDDDDENVQPGEVGLDLANTILLGCHFFGRSLTARSTGPAARVRGRTAATTIFICLRGALSSCAITLSGTASDGSGEVVAARISIAVALLGVLRALGLVAASTLGGEACRIPQALAEAFSGGDVDLVGAANPQAHLFVGIPGARSELTAIGFGVANAFRGFALDVGGVPDALGVEPAGRLSGITAETFDASTLRSRIGDEPTAERVGRASGSSGVDGAA